MDEKNRTRIDQTDAERGAPADATLGEGHSVAASPARDGAVPEGVSIETLPSAVPHRGAAPGTARVEKRGADGEQVPIDSRAQPRAERHPNLGTEKPAAPCAAQSIETPKSVTPCSGPAARAAEGFGKTPVAGDGTTPETPSGTRGNGISRLDTTAADVSLHGTFLHDASINDASINDASIDESSIDESSIDGGPEARAIETGADPTDTRSNDAPAHAPARDDERIDADERGVRHTDCDDVSRREHDIGGPCDAQAGGRGDAPNPTAPGCSDTSVHAANGAHQDASAGPSEGPSSDRPSGDRPSTEAEPDRSSREGSESPNSATPQADGRRRRHRGPDSRPIREEATARRPLFELPTTAHFLSYSRTPQYVEARIVRALAERRPLDHMLVHGVPGSGTTLFARAIVRDYAPRRMVELDALRGVTLSQLARAIERVGELGVLIVRHIELLDAPCEDFLARAMRGESAPPRPERRSHHMPGETPLDRIVRQSATEGRPAAELRRVPRFTLIGTSHILQRLGYALRTAFDHLVHLREDPKALRRAVVRSLRLRGIGVSNDAAPVLERMLGTVYDCAETLVQTCLERVELECALVPDHGTRKEPATRTTASADRQQPTEQVSLESDSPRQPGDRAHDATRDDRSATVGAPASESTDGIGKSPSTATTPRPPRFVIDRELAISIVEEDLPCRLGDEHFAGALRRHLAGRVVDSANENEIAEIAGKLGWSPTTVRIAVETMVREDAAKRMI